jgi:hypothetical protein
MTANSVIRRALRMLGVTSQTPSAEDAAFGLEALNAMLAHWSVQALLPMGPTSSDYTTVAGQEKYTIGAAGDWVGTAPKKIGDVVQIGTYADATIKPITADQYARIEDKDFAAEWIENYWYNRNATATGDFYIWPVPAAATTVRIWQTPIYGGYTLTDTIPLPTEYDDAVAYNLALHYGVEFGGAAVPQIVVEMARETLATVQRMNIAVPSVVVDSTLTVPRPYDITKGY